MNTDVHRSLWKSRAVITATALILLIPLVGSYLTDGWNWDLRGFILVSGLLSALLFGVGLTYEFVTGNVNTIAYRAAVGVAIVASILLVWVNFVQAADDVNPAAVMYFVVPIVGLVSAAIVSFRPESMSRALFATALAQVSVLAIALMIRNPQVTSWTAAVLRGFCLNAFLAGLFVGSALLFRTATREDSVPVR